MKKLLVLLALALFFIAACGADFSPKNELQTIRLLASKADIPYAHPGETVNLEVLAADGRRTQTKKPMRVFWFPAPCVNPPGDQYFACYLAFASLFPEHKDLTGILTESTKVTVTIPANALDNVVLQPGQTERFASAYMFTAACAGHLERIQLKGGLELNQVPIGCFDDATGLQLDETDFVFGYTRIFVFETRRNAVPSIVGVSFEGQPIDLAKGVTTGKCVKNKKTGKCNTVKFDMAFNDSDSEPDPDNIDANGHILRETLYVEWFATHGTFDFDRKLLYDGNLGRRPPGSPDEYFPPDDPTTGTVWAVLHDNRNGVTWVSFPLTIQ